MHLSRTLKTRSTQLRPEMASCAARASRRPHHSSARLPSPPQTPPTTHRPGPGNGGIPIHAHAHGPYHMPHAIEADVVMGGLFQRNGSIHGNARVFGGIAYGADTSYREHILSRSCSAHIPFRSYGEHIPMSEVAEASHAEQKHIQSMCGVWCQ